MKKVVKKFRNAVDSYIEQRKKGRDYYTVLRVLAEFRGVDCIYDSLRTIDEQESKRFRDHVVEKYAGSTASKYVKILTAMSVKLWQSGYLEKNPWGMVRTPSANGKRVRWYRGLTLDEVISLQEVIDSDGSLEELRDGIIFDLLFRKALRVSEVLGLRVEDYSPGEIVVRQPKEGADFILRLDADTEKRLQSFIKQAGIEEGFLLASIMNGVVNSSVAVNATTVNRRLKNYAKKLQIPPFSSHSGRVTAITHLLEKGYNHSQIRTVSRHSSVQMVEKYDRRRGESITIEYVKKNKEVTYETKGRKKLARTDSGAARNA